MGLRVNQLGNVRSGDRVGVVFDAAMLTSLLESLLLQPQTDAPVITKVF